MKMSIKIKIKWSNVLCANYYYFFVNVTIRVYFLFFCVFKIYMLFYLAWVFLVEFVVL
jgi:hypothetical protein